MKKNKVPDTMTTSIELPRALWARVRAVAVERNVSARDIVVEALKRELERKG